MTDTTLELRIDRVLDAPLDAVWTAWTEHQEEWFCPPPWRVEIIEQDLRAGGRSAMVMKGPGGEGMPSGGVILEVVPMERLASTAALTAGCVSYRAFILRV